MTSPSDRLQVGSFVASAPGGAPWYDAMLHALGEEHVHDGMVLLDYGCGNAALGVHLATKLVDFEYFGIEPRRSPHLVSARPNSRLHVGFVGSALERGALLMATCATLGSVVTHLKWEDSMDILDKLLGIRIGAVAFSCFIAEEEEYLLPNHYIYLDTPTWHYAFITRQMIEDYATERRVRCELRPVEFPLGFRPEPQREVTHSFIRLEF